MKQIAFLMMVLALALLPGGLRGPAPAGAAAPAVVRQATEEPTARAAGERVRKRHPGGEADQKRETPADPSEADQTEPQARELAVFTPEDLPDYTYDETDAFANATSLKGVIGLCEENEYDSRHTMWTIDIADCVSLGDPGPEKWDQACWYEYEGRLYCMNAGWLEAQMQDRFKPANENDLTLSVVFVLSHQPGQEFLIEEAARTPGYRFYQPATSGVGGDAVAAFFDFFMWRCLWNEVRVDNFILGNEVNNPNEWNHTGTLDAYVTTDRYATVFLKMYNAVRRYSQMARCSISLDHNWTWNDEGREIPGKTVLDLFAGMMDERQAGVDWCIAYHLYPALMGNTNMWNYLGYTPQHRNAMFIDAMNLNVLSDYVRENFGSNHRIMLTEQGVTCRMGEDSQAAALAVMYYAAKYDPMVDCFILNRDPSEYASLNFEIAGHKAEEVFARLDSGKEEDRAVIEAYVQAVTGRALTELVPNYGRAVARFNREEAAGWLNRLYGAYLERDPLPGELHNWLNEMGEGMTRTQVLQRFRDNVGW